MPKLVFLSLTLMALVSGPAAENDRHEAEIRRFTETDAANPPPAGGVLFLGASSFKRWTTLAQDFPGVPVINRGFGGAEITDCLRYADRIVLPCKPRLVVFNVGENDLVRGKTPERVAGDFRAFRERLHAALPQTCLVYVAIKESPARSGIAPQVRRANQLIAAECAADPRCAFADVMASMRGAQGAARPDLFLEDQVHLNREGYLTWLRVIAPHLRRWTPLEIDLAGLAPDSEARLTTPAPGRLTVEWPAGDQGATGIVTFNLDAGSRLIELLALRPGPGTEPQVIARELEPSTVVTLGTRNNFNDWLVFYDKPYRRLYQRTPVSRSLARVSVEGRSGRTRVIFDRAMAGSFSGQLVFTFYSGIPLIHAETLLSSREDSRALLYDAGLVAAPGQIADFGWLDPVTGEIQRAPGDATAAPRMTRHRAIAAATATGSVAVFPPPHQYIYPLDSSANLGFNWAGRDYTTAASGDGWGVRLPPEGDKRSVPWANAPPDTVQRLAVFYLLSREGPAAALEAVKRFTHADRYVALPGYRTFASHFHVEHTLDLLRQQAAAGSSAIPPALEVPGFVRAFRTQGVDIVHLAEFHNPATPSLEAAGRIRQLDALHAECARLSDENFLLLPGEEPNVHLGGHWSNLFPRPVTWVLNRGAGQPFRETAPDGRKIYHVGGPEDVLRLMEEEGGLMWTAHARIKSSLGLPEAYRGQPFFQSPRFLGAAWKSMPVDYSRDNLGWRALDVLDDMSNWGARKFTVGEVDVFKVEPGDELYGHGNVNYLRLQPLPRFADGWQPVLDVLREGEFFVTTGEVLLPGFTVNGVGSGGTVRRAAAEPLRVRAKMQWTFPLHHAEIVGGDGREVFRHRIDLSATKAFESGEVDEILPAKNWRWVRLEVWDVAVNGAFTQPVWLE